MFTNIDFLRNFYKFISAKQVRSKDTLQFKFISISMDVTIHYNSPIWGEISPNYLITAWRKFTQLFILRNSQTILSRSKSVVKFLPPATGQGYVFTGVYDSVHRGVSAPGGSVCGIPACTEADTPQSRHPLEQTPPRADPPGTDTPLEQTPQSRPPQSRPQSRHPPE